jgi:PPOX class probable F420-dependent enzyme
LSGDQQRLDNLSTHEEGQRVALSFRDVIASKYLLLTTFTKDGRPKPTPIWGVPDGDKLLVITDDNSWKVKRIRNTPRVTIARSGSLGKPKSDEVEAVARVLPKSETHRVYNAVLRRYWYHAWWFYAHTLVRGGIDKVHVGLEIEPAH